VGWAAPDAQATAGWGSWHPGPHLRGRGDPGPKRPRFHRGVRLPPTSAIGAEVTADAACPGGPVIVDRYLAHNEVAIHGNPEAGQGAPGLRLLPGCVPVVVQSLVTS